MLHLSGRRRCDWASVIVSAMLVACLAGCGTSDHDLTFFDADGNAVAAGTINLPDATPDIGSSFNGPVSIDTAGPSFPRGAVGEQYWAKVESDGTLWIDLNEGVDDDNVYLTIRSTTRRTRTGTWGHATLGGGQRQGTVTIAPQHAATASP